MAGALSYSQRLRQLALLASKAELHEKAASLWSRYLSSCLHIDYAARCNYAMALMCTGRNNEAMALYFDMVSSGSLSLEQEVACRVNLSALLISARRLAEAKTQCEAALSLDSQCARAAYNLNVSLRQLGEQERAVALSWAMIAAKEPALNRSKLTVACVKWGSKYDASYVNRLYRGVRKHFALGHEFRCLTDDARGLDDGIQVSALPKDTPLTTWWLKACLFEPTISHIRHGRVLYLDLDTVIVGSLDRLIVDLATKCTNTIAVLATDEIVNEVRPRGYNSSVMLWTAPAHSQIYHLLVDAPGAFAAVNSVIYKFDHWLEMLFDNLGILQTLCPGAIVDYNTHIALKDDTAAAAKEEAPPASAAIVVFPLKPKPHELVRTKDWVRRYWADVCS